VSAPVAKTLAMPEERLMEEVRTETICPFVMPFPLCGRMLWLDRALIMGQGERTSPSPAGSHLVQSMGG